MTLTTRLRVERNLKPLAGAPIITSPLCQSSSLTMNPVKTPKPPSNTFAIPNPTSKRRALPTSTDSSIISLSSTQYSGSPQTVSQTTSRSSTRSIERSSTITHSNMETPQQIITSIPSESKSSSPGDFTQFSNQSSVLIGAIVGSAGLIILVLLIILQSKNNPSSSAKVEAHYKHVIQQRKLCSRCEQTILTAKRKIPGSLKKGKVVGKLMSTSREANSQTISRGYIWDRFTPSRTTPSYSLRNSIQDQTLKGFSFYCASCGQKSFHCPVIPEFSAQENMMPPVIEKPIKHLSARNPVATAKNIEQPPLPLAHILLLEPHSSFNSPNKYDSVSSVGSSSIFIQLVCRDSTYYSAEQFCQASNDFDINDSNIQEIQGIQFQNERYWSNDDNGDETQSPAKLESPTIPNYFFKF